MSGLTADLHDVGMADDRPVPRTRRWGQGRGLGDIGLGEPGQGTLPAEKLEGALPLRPWTLPERQVGEVDLVEIEHALDGHRTHVATLFRRHRVARGPPSSPQSA